MSENTKYTIRKSDRSIFFPLLIIFIGVILLLSNLNLIPGNGWNLIVRFWPIIFIFGGIDDLLNQKWTGAIINFGVGSILILANFGFFSMSTWQIIMNFWPIIIVAIGLEIIFRGRSVVGSLIGVTFSILLVLGLFWFLFQSPSPKNVESSPINFELKNVDLVDLNLEPLVGSLSINPNSSSNQILSGQIFSPNHDEIIIDSNLTGGVQTISISTEGNVIFPTTNMYSSYTWDLALNSEVPFKIKIEQILGSQTLFLQEIKIKDFISKVVIGTMEVTLPETEVFAGNLECVIGEMVIKVPQDIPVTFNIDTGITTISFDDNFVREGDVIYTKNSKGNTDYVIDINLPIGALKIVNP